MAMYWAFCRVRPAKRGPQPDITNSSMRGNSLLLKGLLLACLVTVHGDATFLEHPAMPYVEEYASIWHIASFVLSFDGLMDLFVE